MAKNAPTYNVLDNFGLHHYALFGDDTGVQRALQEGADINSLDAAGRTAVMCVVAGENWKHIDASDASFMSPARLNALKTLLAHPDINLFTLNAPNQSLDGVIPLCMAAWLNQPQAVRILLNDSVDSVSVDGMDSMGATALMYAARDGSLEVVQLLLSHGARPDFRDRNHRTALQFSLAHPHILWLCETVLRRHRWRESRSADRTRLSADAEHLVDLANASIRLSQDFQPPSASIFTPEVTARVSDALISAIHASDVAALHSLLFPPAAIPSSPSPSDSLYSASTLQTPTPVPALVNFPDSQGWSPIHHCIIASQPSIQILDALYCAGADVSLFTLYEKYTPLHILARNVPAAYSNPDATHSLHDFCLHLIQDLRAPLSARDEEDETCLHVAAEHGYSADLLALFLACDTTGMVRQMKNSRGLTPVDVAKTEFLHVFGINEDGKRTTSALSNYTIRPSDSFASLSSISEVATTPDTSSIYSPEKVDIDSLVKDLLTNLRSTSTLTSAQTTDAAYIAYLERQISDIQQNCTSIAVHFRSRIEEASRVVQDLQKSVRRVEAVRHGVAIASAGKLNLRGLSPVHSRRRTRESEDSQLTFVDKDQVAYHFPSVPASNSALPSPTGSHLSSGSGSGSNSSRIYAQPSSAASSTPAFPDRFARQQGSASTTHLPCGLWDIDNELKQLALGKTSPSGSPSKGSLRLKQVMKMKKKLEDKVQSLEADLSTMTNAKKDSPASGTSKIKAWLKRMVVYHHASAPPSPTPSSSSTQFEQSQQVGFSIVAQDVNPKARDLSPLTIDPLDVSIDNTLRTSKVVLEIAQRDLLSIEQCLEAAEQFIDMANHSISRTQRVVKRAIKKREAVIADLRAAAANPPKLPTNDDLTPGLLGYSHAISTRPSMASICTIYSVSSTASVAATLTENDDEDIRIIRRLLLRKMEAQISGAWDDVDKVTSWLQIVKEAVRSVKRRAYL